MPNLRCLAILVFLLVSLAPAPRAGAAEFDIDAQRTVLRRLQYCLDCGAALLVTRQHPGTLIRCPDCGREQARLADQYVITQIYQLCRLCQSPLDPAGRHPGEMVECGNCHTRQTLSRDIFPSGKWASGPGFMPGFPPGSSKKTLLYSPERVDAAITPIPLDEAEDAARLPAALPPAAGRARLDIPPPPDLKAGARPAPPATAMPNVPDASAPAAPIIIPELPNLPPPPAAPVPIQPRSEAVDVPAVSVDLFGGKRATPSVAGPARAKPLSGDMIARVNGSPLYLVEVDRVAAPVIARWREQSEPGQSAELSAREKALRKEILERLIDRELVVKEAERLGHRPDAAAVRKREQELLRMLQGADGMDVRREAERDVIMADMRRRFAEKPVAVRPEAVRDFYRRHTDQLQRPKLLALAELVIFQDRAGRSDGRNSRDIAAEVAAGLERGEKFDDLRRRHDEFAAAAGIAVPEPALLPESAYSSQLMAAGGGLRKGAVFGPVMLEGIVVFGKVVDERPAGPVPFEEVEKEIRQRLEAEETERNLEDWLVQLRQRGVVELYETN